MSAGVRQIVRFNWPFYAAAAAAIVAGTAVAGGLTAGLGRVALSAAVGLAAFWTVASLAASWIVYDRSPLMRWAWIEGVLASPPVRWINIHAGLDESTAALRAMFGAAGGRVFDVFDPAEMTEPSIARARQLARGGVAAERVGFSKLPVATAAADAVFLLLSAHELRSEMARLSLFAEVRRALVPAGRVVVAEHLRDWTNFIAFGPGVFHFHSRRTWRDCFSRCGFAVEREMAITPFVRIFVLRRIA